MRNRGPWPMLVLAAVVVVLALGAGRVVGVGPLAATVPPDQVTDPKEMAARSLQATLDASSVHLAGTLSGSIPGALVDHAEPAVSFDGSTIAIDIRPHDARTREAVAIPGLGLTLDAVTSWNDAWYRFSPTGAWSRTTAGDASAKAGVDANPLTFVDRLRSFLAGPGISATVTDVTCASASGRCHEVTLVAGSDPSRILAAALPDGRGIGLPDVPVTVVLRTDALTLRPAHLEIKGTSADGSVVLDLVLDASGWDGDLVIDTPAG